MGGAEDMPPHTRYRMPDQEWRVMEITEDMLRVILEAELEVSGGADSDPWKEEIRGGYGSPGETDERDVHNLTSHYGQ